MTHANQLQTDQMEKVAAGQTANKSKAPGSFRRSIPFTIDGEPFATSDPSQKASELLRLAGLDPANYDLGELQGKEQPLTKRYNDDELVVIEKDARFVSIRQKAPVA